MRTLMIVAVLVSGCLGYGGFGTTLLFPDTDGLNRRFTELNRQWSGRGSFDAAPPLLAVGGHGAGTVGDFTLGGRGAATVARFQADAVTAEFAGALAFFDAGYAYAPFDYLVLRPSLELGGMVWAHYVHSRESFTDPNFSQWFLATSGGLLPGVEVMGRLPYGRYRYVGLFVKAGYYLSLYGPEWALDAGPPDFGMQGLTIHAGLRFGAMPVRPFRI